MLGGIWGTQEPPFHMFLPSAPTGLPPPAGIHCQPGAIKNILEDFWRLVWERQVHILVTLTKGMENGTVSTPAVSGSVHQMAHVLAGMALAVRSPRAGQAGVRLVRPGDG